MRAALLDPSGKVDNVIMLDEDSDYDPPEGYTLVILDEADTPAIGDQWSGDTWTPPEPPEEPEPPVDPGPTLEERVAELQATVEMLLITMLEE